MPGLKVTLETGISHMTQTCPSCVYEILNFQKIKVPTPLSAIGIFKENSTIL